MTNTTTAPAPEYAHGTIGYWMQHPEERHPDTTESGSAVFAKDFSYNYGLQARDTRDTWTPGMMAHVVHALAGERVILVGKHGRTEIGVVLTTCHPSLPGRLPVLEFTSTLPSGESHKSSMYLQDVQCVIEMQGYGIRKGLRHTAADLLMDRGRLACEAGAAKMVAEGKGGRYGKSSARPQSLTEWLYTYEPQNGPDAGTRYHTTVTVPV